MPLKFESEQIFNSSDSVRHPSATYCKYNLEHVFKTIIDRESHEECCPNKQEFEQKTNIS